MDIFVKTYITHDKMVSPDPGLFQYPKVLHTPEVRQAAMRKARECIFRPESIA